MEAARLASKQQQAASKQQASSSAGPFLAPRATGVPKSKKMLPCYPGWFSATFSVTSSFWSDPHVVRNGDLVGFWPVLGRGYLDKFRAWTENRKTQFPGARGPKTEEKRHHAVRDGCPQLSYNLYFDRPDPHGRGNAKYNWEIGLSAILA